MSGLFPGSSSSSAKDKFNASAANSTSASTVNNVNSTNVNALPGNPIGFATTLFGKMIHLCITVAIGSLILYSCKVAQSNILPTNKTCFPYTDIIAELTEKVINIDKKLKILLTKIYRNYQFQAYLLLKNKITNKSRFK